MNDQSKSYFKQAWNEPRQFFLWLALACAIGFGLAAMFVQQTINESAPATVQLFALIAFVGALGSFGLFMLAWIAPIRQLLTRLLHWRFLILAGMVTFIALLYAVENWRGRSAWSKFRQEWEAKGEKFDLASFIPSPVPDAENFFMTKPWQVLQFTSTNGTIVWENANHEDVAILDAIGPRPAEAPGFGNQGADRRIDLKAWQSFYRGSNNLFAVRNGATDNSTFTNYFPVADAPQTQARDVLLALSRFDDTRQALLEAARRPHARFWINYQDGFACLLPHLSKLKGCTLYLSLHATAALADGQTEVALEDIKLAIHLADAIREEPLLISQLVRVALLNIAVEPIWEGLIDHRWSDSQLVALDKMLARQDVLADYLLGMRGERAFCLETLDYMRRSRNYDLLGEPFSMESRSLLEETLGNSPGLLIPSGWFYQNMVSIAHIHTDYVLPAVDLQKRMVPPDAPKKLDDAVQIMAGHVSPYNLFGAMLMPALGNAAKRFGYAQAMADLARTAIALERYWLANGTYPDSLDELSTRFIAVVPHDIINGQPLKYHRTSDPSSAGDGAARGRFILYSIGWNERDDGGTTVFQKYGKNVDLDEGDWVWRYPEE